MKRFYLPLILLLILTAIAGCQSQGEPMVLLDEKVEKITVSKSNGVGEVNQDPMVSFEDKQSIKIFESAIRTALKKPAEVKATKPDYDIIVEYGEKFPKHAIHCWLGKENEPSTLIYMVGEGETYLTTPEATNQLRELILSE